MGLPGKGGGWGRKQNPCRAGSVAETPREGCAALGMRTQHRTEPRRLPWKPSPGLHRDKTEVERCSLERDQEAGRRPGEQEVWMRQGCLWLSQAEPVAFQVALCPVKGHQDTCSLNVTHNVKSTWSKQQMSFNKLREDPRPATAASVNKNKTTLRSTTLTYTDIFVQYILNIDFQYWGSESTRGR